MAEWEERKKRYDERNKGYSASALMLTRVALRGSSDDLISGASARIAPMFTCWLLWSDESLGARTRTRWLTSASPTSETTTGKWLMWTMTLSLKKLVIVLLAPRPSLEAFLFWTGRQLAMSALGVECCCLRVLGLNEPDRLLQRRWQPKRFRRGVALNLVYCNKRSQSAQRSYELMYIPFRTNFEYLATLESVTPSLSDTTTRSRPGILVLIWNKQRHQ